MQAAQRGKQLRDDKKRADEFEEEMRAIRAQRGGGGGGARFTPSNTGARRPSIEQQLQARAAAAEAVEEQTAEPEAVEEQTAAAAAMQEPTSPERTPSGRRRRSQKKKEAPEAEVDARQISATSVGSAEAAEAAEDMMYYI